MERDNGPGGVTDDNPYRGWTAGITGGDGPGIGDGLGNTGDSGGGYSSGGDSGGGGGSDDNDHYDDAVMRAARQRAAEQQRQEAERAEQKRQAAIERERFEREQRRLDNERKAREDAERAEQDRQAAIERERFEREQRRLDNERKAREAEEARQRETEEQQDALVDGPPGAGGPLGWNQESDTPTSKDKQTASQVATKTVEAVQTGVEAIARHNAVDDLAVKAVKGLSATSKTAFGAFHIAVSNDKVKAGFEVAAGVAGTVAVAAAITTLAPVVFGAAATGAAVAAGAWVGGFLAGIVADKLAGDAYDKIKGKPILLDLDGDGAISLLSPLTSKVMFDFTGDGHAYRTGWVGARDGMLVLDRNNDGLVNGADEISFIGYRAGARTDLEGLRAFDSNGDGRLTAADHHWLKFKVWRDINQNGTSDPGEVTSLASHNLVSLNLNGRGSQREVNGNTVYQQTAFSRSDGTQMLALDVGFGSIGPGLGIVVRSQGVVLRFKAADGTVTEHLIAVRSGGITHDLATNSALKSILGTALADTLTNTGATGSLMIGAGGNDTIAGGTGRDTLVGGDGADRLSGGRGDDVLMFDGDDLLINGGAGRDTALWTGTGGGKFVIMPRVGLRLNVESNSLVTARELQHLVGVETVIGGAARDIILTVSRIAVTLYGMAGNDHLVGGVQNDMIHGGKGHDYLKGGAGNDTLVGGAGNDRMRGDAGRDVFDISQDSSDAGVDTILDFTRGVDKLKLSDSTHALYTRFLDTNKDGRSDSTGIFVADGFPNPENPATNIPLGQLRAVLKGYRGDISKDDFVGSNIPAVKSISPLTLGGTGRADVLHGGLGGDTIRGLAGNDRLYGGIGNDRIYGGDDDDTLYGQHGRDRIWGGDGADTIYGGHGNDILYGGDDDDRLYGGGGNDFVQGDRGTDILTGGDGNDVFIVMTHERTLAKADRITDFSDGDRLLITRTSQVWYDRIDTNRDGTDDATALYTAASGGRIYAVLENFVGPLEGDDFYGSNITQVTEII